MSDQEKQEMVEKLIAEGMSPEDAEKAVAEAAAEGQDEGNHVDEQHGSDDSGDATEKPDETVSEADPNETDEGDTFPRDYVEKLRRENAKYRERAQESEKIAQRLQTALVSLDGRLADPEDLPFDWAYIEDPETLAEAISDLVARKPGLRAQQLAGDAGQGKRGSEKKPAADLISLIRGL